MAKTATYALIEGVTASGSTGTISFTSIPQTFTDLILVISAQSSNGQRQQYMEINADTTQKYSRTILSGTGTSAVSARNSNQFQTYLDYYGVVESTFPNINITHFMDYSNTTTFKTMLTRSNDTSLGLDAIVHLYQSTSAISRIDIKLNTVNYASVSTFRLYGIQAGNA